MSVIHLDGLEIAVSRGELLLTSTGTHSASCSLSVLMNPSQMKLLAVALNLAADGALTKARS